MSSPVASAPSSILSEEEISRFSKGVQPWLIEASSMELLLELAHDFENSAEEKSIKNAAKIYEMLANREYATAQYDYGRCLEKGIGVDYKDLTKAAKLYKAAAEKGIVEAQFAYGSCLENGKGVKRDLKGAAEFYKLAKNNGYVPDESHDPMPAQAQGEARAQLSFEEAAKIMGVIGMDLIGMDLRFEEANKLLDEAHKLSEEARKRIREVAKEADERYDTEEERMLFSANKNLFISRNTRAADLDMKRVSHIKKRALNVYQYLSDIGYAKASYALCDYHMNNNSFDKAESCVEQLADRGDARAKYYLALTAMEAFKKNGRTKIPSRVITLLEEARDAFDEQGPEERDDQYQKFKQDTKNMLGKVCYTVFRQCDQREEAQFLSKAVINEYPLAQAQSFENNDSKVKDSTKIILCYARAIAADDEYSSIAIKRMSESAKSEKLNVDKKSTANSQLSKEEILEVVKALSSKACPRILNQRSHLIGDLVMASVDNLTTEGMAEIREALVNKGVDPKKSKSIKIIQECIAGKKTVVEVENPAAGWRGGAGGSSGGKAVATIAVGKKDAAVGAESGGASGVVVVPNPLGVAGGEAVVAPSGGKRGSEGVGAERGGSRGDVTVLNPLGVVGEAGPEMVVASSGSGALDGDARSVESYGGASDSESEDDRSVGSGASADGEAPPSTVTPLKLVIRSAAEESKGRE